MLLFLLAKIREVTLTTYKKIYGIALIIVTFFGLISIPLTIYQISKDLVYVLISSVILLLILVVTPLLLWIIQPATFKTFGIQKTTNAICIRSSHVLEVQENGEGKWKILRQIVFLKEPREKDLRDLFEMDQPFEIKSFHYSSPDSNEIGRALVKGNRLAIFWSPKKKIYPFEACEHSYEWVAKTSHADPGNYKTTIIDLDTGYHESIVKIPYPIEYFFAFKKPRWRRLRTEKHIYKYAFQCKAPDCPQPKSIDPYCFRWEIHSPELGSTYFCVFFREGGVEYWKKKIHESNIFLWTKSSANIFKWFT